MPSFLRAPARAFVTCLLAVAAACSVEVSVSRDSDADKLRAAYAKVLRSAKAGPAVLKAKELKTCKAAWEAELAATAKRASAQQVLGGFRLRSTAVLLTFQSLRNVAQWKRLAVFVQSNMVAWDVKHWCTTLERCKNGRLHAHVMLQFLKQQDRTSRSFTFESITPNCSANDYLNEGIGGRNPQQSIDRGFFYVFAQKIGTVCDRALGECVLGNYLPAWVSDPDAFKYKVHGKWPEALWKHYKLEDKTYEKYIYLARDGVQPRKRNLEACKSWKEAAEEEAEMEQVIKRIRGNAALYQAFPEVPQVTEWLANFDRDMLRYPLLILQGPSASGKTEYAKSLFQRPLELKVGSSQVFPAKMVEFKRGTHDALILDDVRDLDFLAQHQEKLQGKYDARIEFATAQGGTCFFTKYLFKVPTVVTINFTTKHLDFLQVNDWLSKAQNRVLVQWPPGP